MEIGGIFFKYLVLYPPTITYGRVQVKAPRLFHKLSFYVINVKIYLVEIFHAKLNSTINHYIFVTQKIINLIIFDNILHLEI